MTDKRIVTDAEAFVLRRPGIPSGHEPLVWVAALLDTRDALIEALDLATRTPRDEQTAAKVMDHGRDLLSQLRGER